MKNIKDKKYQTWNVDEVLRNNSDTFTSGTYTYDRRFSIVNDLELKRIKPVIDYDFYPFIDEQNTLNDLKNLNFFNLNNQDFFIKEQYNNKTTYFPTMLYLSYLYGYLDTLQYFCVNQGGVISNASVSFIMQELKRNLKKHKNIKTTNEWNMYVGALNTLKKCLQKFDKLTDILKLLDFFKANDHFGLSNEIIDQIILDNFRSFESFNNDLSNNKIQPTNLDDYVNSIKPFFNDLLNKNLLNKIKDTNFELDTLDDFWLEPNTLGSLMEIIKNWRGISHLLSFLKHLIRSIVCTKKSVKYANAIYDKTIDNFNDYANSILNTNNDKISDVFNFIIDHFNIFIPIDYKKDIPEYRFINLKQFDKLKLNFHKYLIDEKISNKQNVIETRVLKDKWTNQKPKSFFLDVINDNINFDTITQSRIMYDDVSSDDEYTQWFNKISKNITNNDTSFLITMNTKITNKSILEDFMNIEVIGILKYKELTKEMVDQWCKFYKTALDNHLQYASLNFYNDTKSKKVIDFINDAIDNNETLILPIHRYNPNNEFEKSLKENKNKNNSIRR